VAQRREKKAPPGKERRPIKKKTSILITESIGDRGDRGDREGELREIPGPVEANESPRLEEAGLDRDPAEEFAADEFAADEFTADDAASGEGDEE